RLSEDHARAKELAERAREIPGIEVGAPDTNIVMLDFTDDDVSLDGVLAALASSGVLMVRFGPKRLRAVTHLDVDDVGVARASEALAEAMKGTS
ncbi:MAG: hypothetical protein MUO50_05195, partial [Longimicrobiales bacterium]|nr:hypothetical protein [Longimicrobiales bacterium]